MLHGWIILDKPIGLGSTSAVSAVKRALREAGEPKTKVGHGGTLDPLASGVLPIALGEATKLAGRMLDATKSYEFTVAFGSQTDTLDLEGKVIATSKARPTLDEVEAILLHFTGSIDQIPPTYSALKVDGKRAYDLAREGVEFELKAVCECGRKATMNLRVDQDGFAVARGAQTEIGGNDRYVALCRRHFFERLREVEAQQLSLGLSRPI